MNSGGLRHRLGDAVLIEQPLSVRSRELKGGDDLHRRHVVARGLLARTLGLEHPGARGPLLRDDLPPLLGVEEIAAHLGISQSTTLRDLRTAEAWLRGGAQFWEFWLPALTMQSRPL